MKGAVHGLRVKFWPFPSTCFVTCHHGAFYYVVGGSRATYRPILCTILLYYHFFSRPWPGPRIQLIRKRYWDSSRWFAAYRGDNWPLHVRTVKASMGILREFDAISYLRYASRHLERIQVLEVIYPTLYRRLHREQFSCEGPSRCSIRWRGRRLEAGAVAEQVLTGSWWARDRWKRWRCFCCCWVCTSILWNPLD